MSQDCPNFGVHKFTYSVGSGVKTEFEPTTFGDAAADTLYRKVDYSTLACPCGAVSKRRVIMKLEDE